MNYLAHAYLSFNNPGWMVGNLISDFVKGNKRFDYPADIQQGISLHRAIDTFTDIHPATKEAKEFFRPAYRLYSGAFVDITYDHFLAIDTTHFKTETELQVFAQHTYQTLSSYYHLLPPVFHGIFDRMQQHNWLYHYRLALGMQNSFRGLVMRSSYLTESETAFNIFQSHYKELQQLYEAFFPDLWNYAQDYTLQHFS